MRKNIALLSVLLFLVTIVFGQIRVITGRVIDETGIPVEKASVQVKGVQGGVAANDSGYYEIHAKSSDILVFSSINFGTREAKVGDRSIINISLKREVGVIEEVVVTALGVRREKKALGYSVQDIKGDDLIRGEQSDALKSLSGKIAGVQVTSSAGTPGASSYITLRGPNTLTGNNQPLFVIDGIPVNNNQNFSGDPSDGTNALLFGATNSNRGADINPNDIESITVLKGPTAAAIYGIDAANGAIIITTKKGKAGVVQVEFSTGISNDIINRYVPLQNQWVKGLSGTIAPYTSTNRYSWGAKADTLSWDGIPSEYDQHGDVVGRSDPTAKIPFAPYDNQRQFYRTGSSFNNALSVSGGSDNAVYRMFISNLYQNSIVPLQTFSRTSISFNGQVKLSDALKASGSMTYTISTGTMPQQGSNPSGIQLGLLRTPISFDNSNGGLDADDPRTYELSNGLVRSYRNGIYDNPYWTINKNPYTQYVNRLFGNLQFDYKITSGLSAMLRTGTDVYQENHHQYYEIQSGAFPNGRIFDDRYTYSSINSDLIFTYDRDLTNLFHLNFKLGGNYYNNKLDELYTQGDGLVSSGFDNISNATAVKSYHFPTPYRRISGYFDANFSFKSMLFLEITGRNDWSSTLPPDKRSFFYPSASLGWVFTEIPGLKGSDVLSFGKLRASIAQVGKDPGPFNTTSFYVPTTFADGYTSGISFPYLGIGGFGLSNVLGNPNLKPEKTISYEAGVQLQFFNNRLGIDVTGYHSKGEDLIVRAPISGSSGYQFVTLNSGSIQNNGVEVTITARPVKIKDFSWDLTYNFSLNRSKVLELAPGVNQITLNGFTGIVIAQLPNKPAGIIYGFGWLKEPNSGQTVVSDIPGGTFGYPVVDNVNQRELGNPNPKFLMGLGNTLTFKNLSLYFLLDWKNGGDIWNGTRGTLMAIGTSAETNNRGSSTVFSGLSGHLDANGNLMHFDKTSGAELPGAGTTNTTTALLDQNWYLGNGGGFGGQNETFIDDGSYLKLREISVSYEFGKKIVNNNTFIKGLTAGVFTRNVILWTKYKGADPESSLTGATSAQGIDYFNMPGVVSIGINLRAKF